MKRLWVLGMAVAALVVVVPASVWSDPWDNQINNPQRFRVLADFGGTAVLDRETGLVWERAPENAFQMDWGQAQSQCNLKNVGGRRGWRLPAIQELASLVDPSVPSPGPTLPPGHPFHNVMVTAGPGGASAYWSATLWEAAPPPPIGGAWHLSFETGVVANTTPKSQPHWVWCVRTGAGVDVQ